MNDDELFLSEYETIHQTMEHGFRINLNLKKPKEELIKLWDDLYEYYIVLLSKSSNVGFMEVSNILRRNKNEAPEKLETSIIGTPYNRNSDGSFNPDGKIWEEFKADILANGSYFAYFIEFDDNYVRIVEGAHRFYAVQQLVDEGKLPKDHKILCMEAKKSDNWHAITNIAAELGRVERALRVSHSHKVIPRPETKDETYFGYLRKVSQYTNVPQLQDRFKNVCYSDLNKR